MGNENDNAEIPQLQENNFSKFFDYNEKVEQINYENTMKLDECMQENKENMDNSTYENDNHLWVRIKNPFFLSSRKEELYNNEILDKENIFQELNFFDQKDDLNFEEQLINLNQLPDNVNENQNKLISEDGRLRIKGRFVNKNMIFAYLGIDENDISSNPLIEQILKEKKNYKISCNFSNKIIIKNLQKLIPNFSRNSSEKSNSKLNPLNVEIINIDELSKIIQIKIDIPKPNSDEEHKIPQLKSIEIPENFFQNKIFEVERPEYFNFSPNHIQYHYNFK